MPRLSLREVGEQVKSPRDVLSDSPLHSDAEHSRRATTLRRLAGGVRAQQAAALGLNDKQRKLLADAADLLDRIADTSKKAAVLAKKRAADLARREKVVAAAMLTISLRSVAWRIRWH